jgi:hypothetical protein
MGTETITPSSSQISLVRQYGVNEIGILLRQVGPGLYARSQPDVTVMHEYPTAQLKVAEPMYIIKGPCSPFLPFLPFQGSTWTATHPSIHGLLTIQVNIPDTLDYAPLEAIAHPPGAWDAWNRCFYINMAKNSEYSLSLEATVRTEEQGYPREKSFPITVSCGASPFSDTFFAGITLGNGGSSGAGRGTGVDVGTSGYRHATQAAPFVSIPVSEATVLVVSVFIKPTTGPRVVALGGWLIFKPRPYWKTKR